MADRDPSHDTRDVTFGEDRPRIRTSPGVFARLRSFAFDILNANRISTLVQDHYRAVLADIDYLLALVASSQRRTALLRTQAFRAWAAATGAAAVA